MEKAAWVDRPRALKLGQGVEWGALGWPGGRKTYAVTCSGLGECLPSASFIHHTHSRETWYSLDIFLQIVHLQKYTYFLENFIKVLHISHIQKSAQVIGV